MPIHRGQDSQGPYYQWGSRKKYYYTAGNAASRDRAYAQAQRQAVAIYAHGWKGEAKPKKGGK